MAYVCDPITNASVIYSTTDCTAGCEEMRWQEDPSLINSAGPWDGHPDAHCYVKNRDAGSPKKATPQYAYNKISPSGFCIDNKGEGTARRFDTWSLPCEKVRSSCDQDAECVAYVCDPTTKASVIYSTTDCAAGCEETRWQEDPSLINSAWPWDGHPEAHCYVKDELQSAAATTTTTTAEVPYDVVFIENALGGFLADFEGQLGISYSVSAAAVWKIYAVDNGKVLIKSLINGIWESFEQRSDLDREGFDRVFASNFQCFFLVFQHASRQDAGFCAN